MERSAITPSSAWGLLSLHFASLHAGYKPTGSAGEPTWPRSSERQPDPEHLNRVKRKFRIKTALDVVGLTETVLLARE
jgi:hypothetical protein